MAYHSSGRIISPPSDFTDIRLYCNSIAQMQLLCPSRAIWLARWLAKDP